MDVSHPPRRFLWGWRRPGRLALRLIPPMLGVMRLLAALGVFLATAVLIAAGIVLAVNGKPWLLIASTLAFLVGFARIGCTQH